MILLFLLQQLYYTRVRKLFLFTWIFNVDIKFARNVGTNTFTIGKMTVYKKNCTVHHRILQIFLKCD